MQHDITALLQRARLSFDDTNGARQQIHQRTKSDIDILHNGLGWQISKDNGLLLQLTQG